MAMYYCQDCQQLLDDDHHPACENPDDTTTNICPDCELERESRAYAGEQSATHHSLISNPDGRFQ